MGMHQEFDKLFRATFELPENAAPLFRSANDYVEAWGKCEARAKALMAANSMPTANQR